MFRRLFHSQSGAIGIIGALALSAVIGGGALSVELGQGYMGKLDNQRVADMAALGAALAYKSAGGGSPGQATLLPTARDVAKANGITNGANSATVVAAYVDSYGSTGKPAVQVDITTQLPIVLAKVVNAQSSYTIHSTAVAGLASNSGSASGCLIALSHERIAISTTGGASIITSCAINANGGVKNTGTTIQSTGCATSDDPNCSITSGDGLVGNHYGTVKANFINYSTELLNLSADSTISGVRAQKSSVVLDPLAGDPVLYGADGTANTSGYFYNAKNISTIITLPSAITDPVMPSCTYTNWNLTNNASSSPDPTNITYNSTTKVWTIKAGTYCIDSFTSQGGLGTITFQDGANVYIKTNFNPGGPVTFGMGVFKATGSFRTNSYAVTMNSSSVELGRTTGDTVNVGGGGRLVIGDAPVTIGGVLNVSGSGLLKMGAGAHKMSNIVVSGSGSLIAGPGLLSVLGETEINGSALLAAGVNVSGSTLSCPTSALSNYAFGAGSGGDSLTLRGSAYAIMCDGPFSANGIVAGAGGSRLVFGNAANHIVNGPLRMSGSVFFGRGLYTIAGDFRNTTGGTTWPWTYSGNAGGVSYTSGPYGTLTYANGSISNEGNGYDQIGVDVTFVATGVINLGGGARTYLVAPTTTAVTGVSKVLFATLSNASIDIGAGSVNMFNGAIYAPNSKVFLTGGAGISGGNGCFMIVAQEIQANNGTSTASTCANVGSGGGSGGGSSSSPTGSIGLIK